VRGNGDLAQVAIGVEMAVSAGGPLVDGGTDFGWRDRRVLASQTGFDHALGGLEQVKDSEALVWLVPHIFTLMDAAFLPAVAGTLSRRVRRRSRRTRRASWTR